MQKTRHVNNAQQTYNRGSIKSPVRSRHSNKAVILIQQSRMIVCSNGIVTRVHQSYNKKLTVHFIKLLFKTDAKNQVIKLEINAGKFGNFPT